MRSILARHTGADIAFMLNFQNCERHKQNYIHFDCFGIEADIFQNQKDIWGKGHLGELTL